MALPTNDLTLSVNAAALALSLHEQKAFHATDASGHSLASQSKAGFMSPLDKAKLDALNGGTDDIGDGEIKTKHIADSAVTSQKIAEGVTITGTLNGNASSATVADSASKWSTARTITLAGDASGSVSVDGSSDETLTVTVKDDSHNHVISNVDGLQAALDGKASTGSVTEAIATAKSYTDTAVAGLVDSSPDTLNTLNELAAALGDDPNFATTIANQIGAKANDSDVVKLSKNQEIDGTKTFTRTIKGSVSGNAGTAYKLYTARTISLTGDVSGSGSFDGSGDLEIAATVADDSHNHVISNVDGLQSALDSKASKEAGVFYIEGTGDTEGVWLGSHEGISEYHVGLMVAYKPSIAGASGLTLNINSLGAVAVVRNVTTTVTTQYGAGSVVFLVYTVDSDGTAYWKVADYDRDTNTRSSNLSSTKLFLVGAKVQSTSGQTTYSNDKCYVGTDNCLYSNGSKVSTTDTNTTYRLTKSGSTITLTGSDGSTTSVTDADTDTTYSNATTSAAGLMSASDKSKLDGIASGANKYTHPAHTAKSSGFYKVTIDALGHVSSATEVTKADITSALGYTPPTTNTTYSAMVGASSSTAGVAGLVPAPSAGKQTSFLRGDGTWVVPTDTKYTLPTAGSTLGGVKTTSTVTSTSGLTACPIINGVPYYKDTNTTYTLSSFGITATAAELNKLDGVTATAGEINCVDGVTSNIQAQLDGKQPAGSYATKTELTQGLAEKQPTGDYVLTSTLTAELANKQNKGDYVTSSTLTTELAKKQNAGSYATTAQLANKQDKGDYATKTELTNGLATKQAAGDYATKSELSAGLAGKQAAGDYVTQSGLNQAIGDGFVTVNKLADVIDLGGLS